MTSITQIQKSIVELQELLVAIEGLAGNAPAILYTLANEKSQAIAQAASTLSAGEICPSPTPQPQKMVEVTTVIAEETVQVEEKTPTTTEVVPPIVEVEIIEEVKEETPITTITESPVYLPRKELRKSLTLNDRFLFRRELFGNSDTEMHTALDAIQQCATYMQAVAWIDEVYNWDNENDVVIEFLALVEKNFNN